MGTNQDSTKATSVVAAETPIEAARATVQDGGAAADGMYQRVGQLTRILHDALRGLGYDRMLEHARDQIPVARDRLSYVARLTGDAAEKVLDSVDRARIVQAAVARDAATLRARWQAIVAHGESDGRNSTPAGSALVDETCRFFAEVASGAEDIHGILTDIMVAQDFHDLTGQVIRRVVALADLLEAQLLKLLTDVNPIAHRSETDVRKLEGPVIHTEGRSDAVADQAGVDDLLASLGF